MMPLLDHDAGTRCPIIGIGASAGGLEALTGMFSGIAADTPLAFVIVLHLDPHHDSMMAELIGRKTGLKVRQAMEGARAEAGTVNIIPPGRALRIVGGVLRLEDFTEPRGLRRPIDDFFMSLAQDQGRNAACVILSGTGGDGSVGLRSIKDRGGICLAQAIDTARYDGMPLAALGTGLIDHVERPEAIVSRLTDYFSRRDLLDEGQGETCDIAGRMEEICAHIRDLVGHDFAGYKHTSLQRRVARRMQLIGIGDVADYIDRLVADEAECRALFRDFLINVTRFFRDGTFFATLERRALEPLIAGSTSGETLRIWTPGCSTGEEAYTIAMLCAEVAERTGISPLVQIFATDIDEEALATARAGRYPLSALADIPEGLRTKYLVSSTSDIQMSSRLRDMIRFSEHSILRDPAFTRVDLISCRNLLIYLGDKVQNALFPMLHFALKPGGYLFLGPSETVREHDRLFAVVDRQTRLFRKRDVASTYPLSLVASSSVVRPGLVGAASAASSPGFAEGPNLSGRRLIEAYAPASVTLNDRGEILGSTGRLARYFELSGDGGRNEALALARKGLREALGPLLRKVDRDRVRVGRQGVVVVSEFGRQTVDIIADPLPDGHTLVVFIEAGALTQDLKFSFEEVGDGDDRVHQLEEELRVTSLKLRSITEELETANEELKSSNEEMMSMNEELQSTNEELTTTNDELKHRIDQLDRLTDDLRNFFDSTDLAVVILDRDLQIRTFTPQSRDIFPLREADRGRLLSDVARLIRDDGLMEAARAVVDTAQPVERIVQSTDGAKFYQMRVLPYRSFQGTTQGCTLTFADITELRRAQQRAEEERERFELALAVGGLGVWEYSPGEDTARLDAKIRPMFGLPEQASFSLSELVAAIVPDDRSAAEAGLRAALAGQGDYRGTYRTGAIDHPVWIEAAGRVVGPEANRMFVGVGRNVSIERQADEARQLTLREMNHRVKNVFAVVAAIIRLAAKDAGDVQAFAQASTERIAALARAHAVSIGQEGLEQVALEDLVRITLKPHWNERIVLSGQALVMPHHLASSTSLILHEWATNAVKYGALGDMAGLLLITWSLRGTAVEIVWREQCEGAAHGPCSEMGGFGTKLARMAVTQMRGQLETRIEASGFVGRLLLPLA